MVTATADSNPLRALGAPMRDFVLRAKSSLDDEIRSYPTPIPRCDAQFNYAYEQRARLAALLRRIDAAGSDADGANELLRAMVEFSALPPIGESTEEHDLRARITDALAHAGAQVVATAERGAIDLRTGGD